MEKRTFMVKLLGFPAHEQQVLISTFLLSKYRDRSYTLIGEGGGQGPEILMVDADRKEAMAEWESHRMRNSVLPTVLVASRPLSGPHSYLTRPIVANRVLRALDQLTINKLQFVPEFVVQDSPSTGKAPMQEMVRSVLAEAGKIPARFKAMVVDDSAVVRKSMEIELQLHGFVIDFAANAKEATALLMANRYDIAFLDVMLPDGDGYQLSKMIKHDKTKRNTPVIMLTGRSGVFDRLRGKLAGCDTYIAKPASHETLKKVIEQYVLIPAGAVPGLH